MDGRKDGTVGRYVWAALLGGSGTGMQKRTLSHGPFHSLTSFPPISLSKPSQAGLHTCKLILYLHDFLLFRLLRLIPSLGGHLLIDVILHTQAVIQRLVKGLMHISRGRLDGSVNLQVAYPLFGQKKVLHNTLVVHSLLPPYTRL